MTARMRTIVFVVALGMALLEAFSDEPCHTDTECGCTTDCLDGVKHG
jgi:hypothetical protein